MTDLGARILDHIFERLKIDREWSQREESSFTWWGSPLAQKVWFDPAFDDDGMPIYRLHARTDLVGGYRPTKENLALLGLQARMATSSAYIRDPSAADRLQLATSLYVYEETEEWLRDLMAWICAIQATEAILTAPMLAELMGAKPAMTKHPSSGLREQTDDMLNIIEQVVSPAGQASSQWLGPELTQARDWLNGHPFCVLSTGDESGLSAEFPFGSMTSLLRVMTDQANPRMGNGCLMILTIPEGDSSRESPLWLDLNDQELASYVRAPLLGSWCLEERGTSFVSFFPNAMYQPGLLQNFLIYTINRAAWVARDVFSLEFDGSAAPAIARVMATAEDHEQSTGLSEQGAPRPGWRDRLRSLWKNG